MPAHTSVPKLVSTGDRALRARWLAVRDGAVMIVAAGLVFQGLHVVEHLVQVVAWVAAPTSPAFLTPWAVEGRDLLAGVTGSQAGLGNELLHLVGNVIFLAALAGLAAVDRADDRCGVRPRSPARARLTRLAIGWQCAHVAEHVVLTTTAAVAGGAWGASTVFGLIEASTPVGIATRVLFHFVLNAVPTVLTLRALTARRAILGAPTER